VGIKTQSTAKNPTTVQNPSSFSKLPPPPPVAYINIHILSSNFGSGQFTVFSAADQEEKLQDVQVCKNPVIPAKAGI
jgi:hypothetical protein